MRNFVITVNGKSYEVGVEEVGSAASAPVVSAAVPQTAAPAVQAPKTAPQAAPSAPKAAPANGEKLLSPFPGLIKKFLVEEGASVKKDQPVLILEAMKMDNDITSPCDGKISFKTVVGNNVETNTVLAVIG